MKTAIVIPSRFNSSRFPGKPLIEIDGVTLIQRTYRQALACKNIDYVVVATDDDRIAQHVASFGGNICMTPLSCETGSDRVGAALEIDSELQKADIIINIQGDEPCILPSTVEQVHSLLFQPHVEIATAVSQINSLEELLSPNIVKCALSQHSNRLLYLSRLPIPGNKSLKPALSYEKYRKHLGIYGFKKESLVRFVHLKASPLQQEEDIEIIRALEYDMGVYACYVATHPPGVDVPEDIALVQAWIQRERLYG